MPVVLALQIALYGWLVSMRTRGIGGRRLDGDEVRGAEKMMRLVRGGLLLSAIIVMLLVLWTSKIAGAGPAAAGDGSIGSWFDLRFTEWTLSDSFRLVIKLGTFASFGITALALARVIQFWRNAKRVAAR